MAYAISYFLSTNCTNYTNWKAVSQLFLKTAARLCRFARKESRLDRTIGAEKIRVIRAIRGQEI